MFIFSTLCLFVLGNSFIIKHLMQCLISQQCLFLQHLCRMTIKSVEKTGILMLPFSQPFSCKQHDDPCQEHDSAKGQGLSRIEVDFLP